MYYGWIIVAGAFLAQFFMTGFFTYGFPFMVVPVEAEFGVSRTEVMYGITWSTGAGLLLAPLIGMLADKWSIRWLMAIGAAIFGTGLILLSYTQNILQFSLLFAVFVCLANNLLGPLTGSTVVARWFSVSRGKALGIAAVGTSVGGMIIPKLMGLGITDLGWRETVLYFGITVLVLLLPFLLILMRNSPAEKGLGVEGVDPDQSNGDLAAANIDGPELSVKQILATPSFWFIGLTLGLLFMSQTGVLTNLTAYATGLGLETGQAAQLIFVIAGMGFIGKLLFGYAADRINLKFGLWIAIILAGSGISILATEPDYSVMLIAAFLMGLATGGMLPVWGAIIAVVFGMKSYGRVMGAMMPVIALSVMPGPILAAYLFDQYGSYSNSFYLFVGVLCVSFVLLIPVKLSPVK